MNSEQRLILVTVLSLFATGFGALAARTLLLERPAAPASGDVDYIGEDAVAVRPQDVSTTDWLCVFDLTRLPPGLRKTLTLILLLPVAALVTSVFRTLIGIRTFGTFTPGLIALSLVQTDWRAGTIIFLFILAAGILVRLTLNRLHLLMVSRLSLILTAVVLAMVLTVSVLDYLAWTPSGAAVLLPLVIVTMVVERFHVCAEEDGLPAAARTLAATLLVAAVCFLVIRPEFVAQTVLRFPEALLPVMAVLILIGRYTGYRISELWRFRDLTAPPGGPA